MKISFFPGAAVRFAGLNDHIAGQVLDQLRSGLEQFERHQTVSALSGDEWDLASTRLDRGWDLFVCQRPSTRSLAVVGLDRNLDWEEMRTAVEILASGGERLLIGEFPIEMGQRHSLLRILRAYAREVSFLAPDAQRQAFVMDQRVLSDRLAHVNVQRWKSTEARNDFRALLDRAITEPQIVERDNDEVIVIGRDLLDAFEDPKSALELANYFAAHPLEPLTPSPRRVRPRERVNLPDLPDLD